MRPLYIALIAVGAIIVVSIIVVAVSPKTSILGGSIGVIEITGPIVSSGRVVKNIRHFGDNATIKGLLIRVDSPGGGVAASQEIYSALRHIKAHKKIVVSMGSVAASGGYYVSLPADKIVANPGTITGSIGVIMEFPIFHKLLDKLGIKFETIKSEEFKDIGSPFRDMTDQEKKLLKSVVLDVYDQFVTAVSEERNIDRSVVLRYADGRILSGRQAYKIGLVDTLGSFEDAVRILGDLVGISGRPKLIYPPRRFNLIDLLLGDIEERLTVPRLEYIFRCGD